jgi:hypothetical protein
MRFGCTYDGDMNPTPDWSLPHLAKFLQQHTHDVCNDLNSLDLEAALLAEIVPGGEAGESVARIRGQIRRLAADLRRLTANFTEPQPTRALYAASELFLIWQDQLVALDPMPAVQWSDMLGTEQVLVDATALANVFRELLANAQAFGTGTPVLAAARVENARVVFELREPKDARVDPAGWGGAPLAAIRPRHYGLGLWKAHRTIAANGGELRRRFTQDSMELITTLLFSIA